MTQQNPETRMTIPAGRGKSRKFRVCMRRILALPVVDDALLGELGAIGIDESEANNYMLVAYTVFKKALGGDLKFIDALRQIASDNETEIDRATGIAQLDKLRAQTEEIRRKFRGDSGEGEQSMAALLDVLSRSADSLSQGETEGDDS